MSMPTEKMSDYAIAIAEGLGLDLPDLYDFGSVYRFIREYSDKYKNRFKEQEFISNIQQLETSINKKFSKTFVKGLERIKENTAGLYFFFADHELLYIGKSTNIRERIISSLRERYSVRKDLNMVFGFSIPNLADLQIAEPYLICKLKPTLNIQFNVSDYPVYFKSEKYDDIIANMKAVYIFEEDEVD